ncbi:hypothetical protein HDV05_001193, partial [Chytridiales sp. JEL 0842]
MNVYDEDNNGNDGNHGARYQENDSIQDTVDQNDAGHSRLLIREQHFPTPAEPTSSAAPAPPAQATTEAFAATISTKNTKNPLDLKYPIGARGVLKAVSSKRHKHKFWNHPKVLPEKSGYMHRYHAASSLYQNRGGAVFGGNSNLSGAGQIRQSYQRP